MRRPRPGPSPRDTGAGDGYDAAPMSPSPVAPAPRPLRRVVAARVALAASTALAALAAALLAGGCGAGAPCHTNADCPGGACGAGGVCVPPAAADGGVAGDGGGGPAGADGGTDGGGTDGGLPACTPTHDGTITRSEVTFRAGESATFRVATGVPVDTAGTYDPDGTRHWHLAGDLKGDHDVNKTLLDPAGTWWAKDFPGATYAARLRDGQDLFGVFQATPSALMLLGVVSGTGGLTRTELTYRPALTVLSFPLKVGKGWRTDATASGLAQGVAAYYGVSWVNRVDAAGRLDTPYGTFDVLRVRVETTQTVGVVVTPSRSFLFVSECFGTVASIFSNPGETSVEFTQAAEVDRLAR